MRVRILISVSDVDRNYEGGEVCEMPDERAEQFIKQRIAEAASGEAIAPAAGVEAAALAPARRRG